VRLGRFPTGVWRGLQLNVTRGPLADARVRKAIDLVLDRGRLVQEALGNYGRPAVLPLYLPLASVPIEPPPPAPPDPTQAAILLEEAGWIVGDAGVREKKGVPLELRFAVWEGETFRRRASELLRGWLESIGVVVHLQLVDNETYAAVAAKLGPDWDGTISGWGGRLDPIGNLYKKFHSQGSQNATGFKDPAVDAALQRLLREPAPESATALWREVLDAISQARAILPLVYPDYLFAWSHRLTDPDEGVVDAWHEFPRYAWTWTPAPVAEVDASATDPTGESDAAVTRGDAESSGDPTHARSDGGGSDRR